MSYGWNSTSCQILNPGINHWFSSAAPAVVGYIRRNNLLAVAGAPACAPEALPAVCDEFEAFARGAGCRVCYVCAEERLYDLFARCSNHASIVLGAQPVWDPRAWPEIVGCRASLRAQLNRSRNKGVTVESLTPELASKSQDLRNILREWLDSRRLPPLHFLVEPDVLEGAIEDRLVLVAQRQRKPVAFLVASPIASKGGYLVELLARSPFAPNGTSELLIDAAMRRLAQEGCRYVTLGLVALTHAAESHLLRNPFWLRNFMWFSRAHANRFYNFRGLEHFRLKMAPQSWEPVYAISNERRFSLRTLYDVGGAFSGISPLLAMGIGLMKAIHRELVPGGCV
jgi:phosphatidylglycerol lysyltransferase